MQKDEAVKKLVDQFQAVPQEWVRTVAESKGEYPQLGMWGTCFIVDEPMGDMLAAKARPMYGDARDLRDNLHMIDSEEEQEKVAQYIEDLENEEIDWEGSRVLENYIDEEMAYELCILDADGDTTAVFIHDVAGEYVLSINAAGFNFYDGVWDRLYDTLDLKWHDNEDEQ